tara:strand:- start:922 stop:1755 length:834 start_codon:yes stop_codon:yes gene_type:complete
MKEIALMNGEVWKINDILLQMRKDPFYYDYLSTEKVLSKSSISGLIPPKSPKAWYYGSGKKASESAFRAGSLFHWAILEPEKYEEVYFSKYRTRTAAGFKDERTKAGKEIYSEAEREFNQRLVQEFTVNKKAMSRLNKATSEVPQIGYINGLPFRGKADLVSENGKIYDLKTCGDLKDFPRNAYDYAYDLQVYIYCELFGCKAEDFEFIAISKNTYDVGFFKVDKSFYNQGKERLNLALDVYTSIFYQKTDEEIRETLNELSFENVLYSLRKYKNDK